MKKKKRILPIKASASSETSSSSDKASPSANGPASPQEPQPPVKASGSSETSSSSEKASPSANGPASLQEPQPGTSTGGVTPSCPQVNIQCGSESSDSESDGDHDNDPEWRPPCSVPMNARKTSNPSGSITFIMLIGVWGGLVFWWATTSSWHWGLCLRLV